MLDIALEFLKLIDEAGYKAYIVGGFVRDKLLGVNSLDIDVSTNATPKELVSIFPGCVPNEDYGSVIINYKNIRFEVTTFRRESGYSDLRHPDKVEYIDDLYQDLLRRDFTINTICIDVDGEIIDFLAGRDDLNKRVIKTVGNANERFNQDALRILRAIRFAATLDFSLDDEVVEAIKENRGLLKNISYNRKKSELEKIFSSAKIEDVISLLIDLGLDKELELNNLDKINSSITLMGIWALLDVVDIYPFSNNEKDIINSINEVLSLDLLDPYTLYKYDLYVCSVASEIMDIDKKLVTEVYSNLSINERKDINISSEEIMSLLDIGPSEYLGKILDGLELAILYNKVTNTKEELSSYIVNNYNKDTL